MPTVVSPLATRIALYEAGASANYLEVDPKTKVVQNDGSDFRKVNPLGLVPTLRTDDGELLTVRTPVGAVDILDHFARRSTRHRQLRERADALAPVQAASKGDRDIASR